MTMTEMAVYELDTMLADGATRDQYETWLGLILGEIEIESARD